MPLPALVGIAALASFIGNLITKFIEVFFKRYAIYVGQIIIYLGVVYTSLSAIFTEIAAFLSTLTGPSVIAEGLNLAADFLPPNTLPLIKAVIAIEASIFIAKWLWSITWLKRIRL